MENVIIIGGGPGGSGLGCYLSKLGIPNLIIEHAIHPRPHVGESLVPSTTRIFNEIGFLHVMEELDFPKKYGAWWNAGRFGNFDINFAEFPQPGVTQDHTYHVDRSKFDLALIKHAESLGSKVIQGVAVKEVMFKDSYACGVVADIGGRTVELPAKMVVDASGRNAVLGRQLKLRKMDPKFNQFAVHAWFKNVDRGDDYSREYIRIFFIPVERGWVWQIPITSEITSVGVVVDKKIFQSTIHDVNTHFYDNIKTSDALAHSMVNAVQTNDFKIEADYSYVMDQFAGNGFVLIGDAARFVDPIFSSGVSVALTSAKFASERIKIAFETGDFSRATFEPYEKKLRNGTNIWYEFISQYYRLLPLFNYFVKNRDHRYGVLQLLQGEVYDRETVPVLEAMRKFIIDVESSKNHFMYASLRPV